MKLKVFLSLCMVLLFIVLGVNQVNAQQVLGVHILQVEDLRDAEELLEVSSDQQEWKYVTIPFTLADIEKHDKWQEFFDTCKNFKIKPIIRLATSQSNNGWKQPTYKNIIELSSALTKLDWPDQERLVIVFNEPNHKGEWDGEISPVEYADILEFASRWFHTETKEYKILPAALDLAAPNGPSTMEAFTFWRIVLHHQPEIFSFIDAWNSHSYPNPAFSSSPFLTAQNSIRGYQHELKFVKDVSNLDLAVYITETGWAENWSTYWRLNDYYKYTAQNVWSDPRVKAVTPFLLKGSPGPFSTFSFLDENGNKTKNYEAYRQAIESIEM